MCVVVKAVYQNVGREECAGKGLECDIMGESSCTAKALYGVSKRSPKYMQGCQMTEKRKTQCATVAVAAVPRPNGSSV